MESESIRARSEYARKAHTLIQEISMKAVVFIIAVGSAVTASADLAQSPVPTPGAPVTYEKKDDEGRLINRITFRQDGTITHVAVAYGPGSETLTVEEDLDPKREAVRRFREKTDRRGRPVEREEMTVEGARRVTKRTKFKYDAKGRQTAETKVTE
jgi:hypothetical protein